MSNNNDEYPKELFEKRKQEFLDRGRKLRQRLLVNLLIIIIFALIIIGVVTLYVLGVIK